MDADIRDYYNSILDALAADWSGKGFRTHPRDKFTRTVDGVLQRLAMSLRELPNENAGYVEVYVGFNFAELETLAADLQGEMPRRGFLTCSLNLGLLTAKGELLEWPLRRKEDVSRILRQVQPILADVAVPFWNEFLSLENLLAHYEAGDPRVCGGEWFWEQMAAYCLLGKPERAVRLLSEMQEAENLPQPVVETARRKLSAVAHK